MEEAFIRACLAHLLDPGRPLPGPPPEMDWERVTGLLARHKLAGVFYRLGKEQPTLLDEAIQQRLRRDYHSALLWGKECSQEASLALARLRQAGVPTVVLKGWALIPTVYQGDFGQRTFADIDLLVPPQRGAESERILLEMGYRARLETWPGFSRRYENGRSYQKPRELGPFRTIFAIGLHWALLDTPFYFRKIPVEKLFVRASPLQVAGVGVLALSPEDHLVYACGHLAMHHRYDPALYRFYEIAALFLRARQAFDWEAVLARAAGWRLVLPVQRVLAHLDGLWPGLLPAEVLVKSGELTPTLAERWVHDWMVKKRDNNAIRALVTWLTLPGVGKRLGFLLETAFPRPAYMRGRYCRQRPHRWPLAYLLRVGLGVRFLLRALPGNDSVPPGKRA